MNTDAAKNIYQNEILDSKLQEILTEVEMQALDVRCGLNHGIPLEENPLAVDYLCQNLGDQVSGVVDSVLQIPICAECLISLFSENQLLLLCLNCTSSQWIFRPEAKLEYPKDQTLFFVKQCPKCYDPSDI